MKPDPDEVKEYAANTNYELKTEMKEPGRIIHSLIKNHSDKLAQWVVDTMEKATHMALVELGWTPPKE